MRSTEARAYDRPATGCRIPNRRAPDRHTLVRSFGVALARPMAICLLICSVSASAIAHPHVWVTVETTVVFEQGSVVGLRHRWMFDEFYTAMAVEGLDTNKDGKYSREELAELAKVNVEGLHEFQYFTHVSLGGKPLTFNAPTDYWLEYVDKPADPDAAKEPKAEILPRASAPEPAQPKPGFFSRVWDLIFGAGKTAVADAGVSKVLALNFMLPLRQPVLTDAPDFAFSVYDPSFFIALELAKVDPIRVGTGAPAGCRIEMGATVETPPPSGATKPADGFAMQSDQPGFGFTTSTPIKLICGPRI